jgi:O-antigen ligase
VFSLARSLRSQNYVFLALLLGVGLLPAFHNGYQHPLTEKIRLLVAGMALLATLGVGGGARRPADGRPNLVGAGLLLFLAWAGASFFWSVDRENTLSEWLNLAMYALAFYLAANFCTRREAVKFIRFLLIYGVLLAVVGIAQFLLLNFGRITATFINPNPFGDYLAMLVLLALPVWLARAAGTGHGAGGYLRLFVSRPALTVALLLLLTALILTGSRGAWIAFAATTVVLLLLLPGRAGVFLPALLLLLAAAVLLTVALAYLAPWLQRYEFVARLGREILAANLLRLESFGSSSVGGRLSFWLVALRETAARPLTGFGLGNFHSVYFFYWPGDEFYSKYVHNHYLQTAADLGLPGLLLLTAVLVLLLALLWQRVCLYRRHPLCLGLFGACLAFLLHSGVDFTWDMPAVTFTFWALAGVTGGLGRGKAGAGRGEGADYPSAAVQAAQPPPTGGSGRLLALSRQRPVAAAFGLLAVVLALFTLNAWLAGCYQTRGVAAARDNRQQQAVAAWERAAKLVPWSATPWYYEAKLWSADPARGEAAAWEAVRRQPYDQGLRIILARFQEMNGRLEAAEANLKFALQAGGYYPGPHLALGEFYLRRGRWQEAVLVLARGLALRDFALARAPYPGELYRLQQQVLALRLGLGKAQAELGNYRAAREELQQVLAADPENAVARRLFDELGRRERAGPGMAGERP